MLLKILANYSLPKEEVEAIEIAQEVLRRRKHEKEYSEKLRATYVFKPHSLDDVLSLFHQMYLIGNKRNFESSEFNERQLANLALYFANQDKFCSVAFKEGQMIERPGDLTKGLLITGKPGCGKTSILSAFKTIGAKGFRTISTKELERTYDATGFAEIETYMQERFDMYKRPCGTLFDDFGYESPGKHYGKEKNVMEDVLEQIYNNRAWSAMFITSNLTIEQMNDKYGPRIISRMKEMFNHISFSVEAPDMRK